MTQKHHLFPELISSVALNAQALEDLTARVTPPGVSAVAPAVCCRVLPLVGFLLVELSRVTGLHASSWNPGSAAGTETQSEAPGSWCQAENPLQNLTHVAAAGCRFSVQETNKLWK